MEGVDVHFADYSPTRVVDANATREARSKADRESRKPNEIGGDERAARIVPDATRIDSDSAESVIGRVDSSAGLIDPASPHTPPRSSSSRTTSELGCVVADAEPSRPSTQRRVTHAVLAQFYDSLRQQRIRLLNEEACDGAPAPRVVRYVEFDSVSEASSCGDSRESSSGDASDVPSSNTCIVQILTTNIHVPPPDPLHTDWASWFKHLIAYSEETKQVIRVHDVLRCTQRNKRLKKTKAAL